MPEATRKWKVDFIRRVIATTPPVSISEGTSKDAMLWIQDMVSDRLLTATIQRNGDTSPNLFHNLIATPAGKEMVKKYEADTTFSGMWREHHKAVLIWIFSNIGTLIAGFLIGRYGWK